MRFGAARSRRGWNEGGMKKLLAIFLIAGAVGGGYWLSRQEDIDLFALRPKDLTLRESVEGPTDIFKDAKDAVTSFVSRRGDEAEKKSKDAMLLAAEKSKNVVDEGKTSLVEKIGDITRSAFAAAVERAGGFLGIATTTERDEVVSSLLGTVVKRGQPLTFVISNDLFAGSNAGEASYGVSWGDGGEERARVYAETKNKFITHTFHKVGEYRPLFVFNVNGGNIRYENMIVVEE